MVRQVARRASGVILVSALAVLPLLLLLDRSPDVSSGLSGNENVQGPDAGRASLSAGVEVAIGAAPAGAGGAIPAVAVASWVPPGFELYSTEFRSEADERAPVHVQNFVRGTRAERNLAAIKFFTIDTPFNHSEALANYEGASSVTVAGKDAVLYFTVPEAPREGLIVVFFELTESRHVEVVGLGAVTTAEVLGAANGVVKEVAP